jgi:hypothetical protein
MCNPLRPLLRSCRRFFHRDPPDSYLGQLIALFQANHAILEKLMSSLTDLQAAAQAEADAIAALAARVAAIVPAAATDADLAAVTAQLVAGKAALDAIDPAAAAAPAA